MMAQRWHNNDKDDDKDDNDGNGATGDRIHRRWQQRWLRKTTTMRSMVTT